MSKETVLKDDLNQEYGAETVRFGLDGKRYEIDLTAANRKKLEDALAPFIRAGRRATAARSDGRPSRTRARSTGSGTDWTAPENAGMPHQGNVKPAEAKYVREHLDEVNQRRTAAGAKPLDPSDPKTKKRYGFK